MQRCDGTTKTFDKFSLKLATCCKQKHIMGKHIHRSKQWAISPFPPGCRGFAGLTLPDTYLESISARRPRSQSGPGPVINHQLQRVVGGWSKVWMFTRGQAHWISNLYVFRLLLRLLLIACCIASTNFKWHARNRVEVVVICCNMYIIGWDRALLANSPWVLASPSPSFLIRPFASRTRACKHLNIISRCWRENTNMNWKKWHI